MLNRPAEHYIKYDAIVNKVIEQLYFLDGKKKSKDISFRDFDLRYSFKDINCIVSRYSSYPLGSMAAFAMDIKFQLYKTISDIKDFKIKFNQVNNTIGFMFYGEFVQKHDDFDKCLYVYRSDDIEKIELHIQKVMQKVFLIPALEKIGNFKVDIEDFDERYYEILKMARI